MPVEIVKDMEGEGGSWNVKSWGEKPRTDELECPIMWVRRLAATEWDLGTMYTIGMYNDKGVRFGMRSGTPFPIMAEINNLAKIGQ